MKNIGFTYNSTICVSCGGCQVACQSSHGLNADEFYRRVVITSDEKGQSHAYSGSCNHCEEPACVQACPTGAMYVDEKEGVVLHDDGICIGCGCCVWNCPYGSVSISLSRGVSQKCDSCIERRAEGLAPYCVAACPMNAIGWRDHEEGDGWERLSASFLPSSDKTLPTTLVKFRGGEEE